MHEKTALTERLAVLDFSVDKIGNPAEEAKERTVVPGLSTLRLLEITSGGFQTKEQYVIINLIISAGDRQMLQKQ